MRFVRLAGAALALAGLSGPAFALCPICNSSVRLDSGLAACFTKRVDAEVARLKSEGKGFVIVDLSDCPDAPTGRTVLPTDTRAAAPAPLDSTFVADDAVLKCLGDAITAHVGPFDPSVLFDLAQICS